MTPLTFLLPALVAGQGPDPDRIPPVPGPALTRRTDLPPRVRAEDLVARMTLREKVGQLVHEAPAIPRLGVPAYVWWNECLHGVARSGTATVFPQATALAASWDPEMLERVADAISTEGRAKHHDAVRRGERGMYTGLTFWSPNINLFRDPRWGRGQETYGEDPFLTGKLGAAFVRGIQGHDPKYLKAVATPKHFAVHSGPEADRHRFNAVPAERDFWESYLPHFEAVIREGGAWSVMGAYNRVYGVPCCASPLLLDEILRKRWGFKGYVVSDCWAVTDMYTFHKVFPSKVEAAAASLKAGCDVECGVDYQALLEARQRGLVTDAELDRALVRAFEARFRLGMFDPDEQVPFARIPMSAVNGEAHRALALEAARKAFVLLKNDGTLPLDARKLRRIGVVGPNADTVTAFIGNYNGSPRRAPTVLEALRARLGRGVEVVHLKGTEYTASTDPFAPVPDVLLEADGKPGLRAEYFAAPDLKGDPALLRQDAGVAFQDEWAPHVSGWPVESGSARWTGTFTAPSDGTYRLGLRARQKARLWLDGELAVDAWDAGGDGKAVRSVPLPLKAGQRVAVRLDYSHGARGSLCQFLWDRKDLDLTAGMLERLRGVDALVFVGGLNGDLEGEEGEPRFPLEGLANGDRLTIELPRIQAELLGALRSLGKPTVLVNMSGGATALPEHPNALLQAWYPGEAGGEVLAKVLLGDEEPGGRLPVTFYRSTADLPPMDDYRMEGRTYRFFRGAPQFPFGHGLGYATFTMEALELPKGALRAEATLTVRFTVRNTAARAGEVLPQVYVARHDAEEPMPLQDLRAFRRVSLKAGESRTVALRVPLRTLRRWDGKLKGYRVDPGEYEIRVGTSSADTPLRGRIRIAR